MPRLQDAPGSGIGSATHLLWLALMGLKDAHCIMAGKQDIPENYVYNNGMNFIAKDVLTKMKRDNDNKNPDYFKYFEDYKESK